MNKFFRWIQEQISNAVASGIEEGVTRGVRTVSAGAISVEASDPLQVETLNVPAAVPKPKAKRATNGKARSRPVAAK